MENNEEKKSIGAMPATSVDNGQNPNNTRSDSERKEKRAHDIPASQTEYNNPGKAALERFADKNLKKDLRFAIQ